MHKIQKYQIPAGGLPSQNIYDTINNTIKYFGSDLQKTIKLQSNPSYKMDFSQQNGLSWKPPQSTSIPKSNGFLTGNKGQFKGLGKDLLGEAPALIGAGLEAVGVKRATLASGFEEGFDKASEALFKGALKTGNPLAIGITGAVAGLSKLNMYAGKNTKKQGTQGLDTGPYAFLANEKAGQKTTLIGRGKAKKIDQRTTGMDRLNLKAGDVNFQNSQNQLAASNTYGDIATRNQQKLIGGLSTNILSAKIGAKINPKQLSNIKKKAQRKVAKAQSGQNITDGLQTFALGGQLNVIPEGALHAHKNHYEGDLAEQVTAKGIPVITYDKDEKITQHAEIEHSEIIFTKEVTVQLEKWEKEYRETEDNTRKKELELECGKYLTEQILENTEDNMNLIEQIS